MTPKIVVIYSAKVQNPFIQYHNQKSLIISIYRNVYLIFTNSRVDVGMTVIKGLAIWKMELVIWLQTPTEMISVDFARVALEKARAGINNADDIEKKV